MKVKRILLPEPCKMTSFQKMCVDWYVFDDISSVPIAKWSAVYMGFEKTREAKATKVKTDNWDYIKF
jgi:hypothetical protein